SLVIFLFTVSHTTRSSTLSLHDALPISMLTFFVYIAVNWWATWYPGAEPGGGGYVAQRMLSAKDEKHSLLATLWFNIAHYAVRRSEEHTSELQSPYDLVCRLLLEKKIVT